MTVISEKLLNQARAKAAGAAKTAVCKINGRRYTLAFNSTEWVYRVTDDAGEWVVNINSKSATAAKRFLADWLAN